MLPSYEGFVVRYRVIFGDTDAGGIVYHPRYLDMAERGRNEIIRSSGLDVGKLFSENGYGFALRKCQMKFQAPAVFDDLLTIQTRLSKLGAATSVWSTHISRMTKNICSIDAEIICIERKTSKPVLFPGYVVRAFQSIDVNQSQGQTNNENSSG